jgi:hypothetical protein
MWGYINIIFAVLSNPPNKKKEKQYSSSSRKKANKKEKYKENIYFLYSINYEL